MKNFKSIVMFLIIFSGGAWAQTFTVGYSSLVVFTDDYSTQPTGETEAQCQENEDRIVADYLAMFDPDDAVAVDPSRSLPCGPRTSTVPELDLAAWGKLPFPPECRSCPMLHPNTFEIYYPNFEDKIKHLYFQFGIDQYNKELQQLQQKYDLQSFEKAVFQLNKELNYSQQ